jgi:hypothetical protein
MFGRITIFSTILFFVTGAVVFIAFVQPRPNEESQYEKFGRKRPHIPPEQLIQTPAHQVRTDVQKDYWTLHKGKPGHTPSHTPSHTRLRSIHSDLWIQPRKGKFEIREYLHSIEGCQQELSFVDIDQTPRQEVRYFTAKEGSLVYPASAFEAKETTVQVFTLFDHQFPESAPKIAPHSSLSADCASWIWQEPLHVMGNVRLFSEKGNESPTFALADELLFYGADKKIELRSNVPQKVLLWQNELRLSSPAIQIERNGTYKTEQIRGVGDAHFYFNGEEEAIFQKIFGIKNL